MKKKCILGCPNNGRVFRFPEDHERRLQWFNAINTDYTIVKAKYLCDRHFSARQCGNKRRLRTAVPDINLEPIECPKAAPGESANIQAENSNIKSVSLLKQTSGAQSNFLINKKQIKEDVTQDKQTKATEHGNLLRVLKTPKSVSTTSNTLKKTPMATLEMMLRTKELRKKEEDTKLLTTKICGETIPRLSFSKEQKSLQCGTTKKLHQAKTKRMECFTEATQTGSENFENCGFIQRSRTDGKYRLTCFHCTKELQISNWHQYIIHYEEVHFYKRKSKIREPLKVSNISNVLQSNLNDETNKINDTEKCNPVNVNRLDDDTVSEIINEIVVVQSNANTEKMHPSYNDGLDEDTVSEIINEIVVLQSNDEDTVSDVKQYVETQSNGSAEDDKEKINPLTIDGLDDDTVSEVIQYDTLQSSCTENFDPLNYSGLDEDTVSSSSCDNDHKTIQNSAVIDFQKTNGRRTRRFLQVLKAHPLLWHPRGYGPDLFDDEINKFLNKFDSSMTIADFNDSLNNVRKLHSRFKELNLKKTAKLRREPKLKAYVDEINEIAELSESYHFKCELCSYHCNNEANFFAHQFRKHNIGNNPYVCSCGKEFANSKKKKAHEASHNNEPNFACKYCDFTFFSERKLTTHILHKHPDKVENPLRFYCPKCDEKFATSYMLKYHILKHDAPRHVCEICGKGYFQSFHYKLHIKSHLKQLDFICEVCGKAFLGKRHLETHRLKVHKLGEHLCKPCRTYFKSNEALHQHTQKHHPNGTNLDRKTKMHAATVKRYHERLKAAGKPLPSRNPSWKYKQRRYQCPHCNKIYNSYQVFIMHLRKVHNLQVKYSDIKNYEPYTEESVGKVTVGVNIDVGYSAADYEQNDNESLINKDQYCEFEEEFLEYMSV